MMYAQPIADQLNVKPGQVTAVINLLDDGNTIPFIARYRKEATGSLDEEQIRQIQDQLGRLRTLDERRSTIIASIKSQDKLTPELEAALQAAQTMTELEDLYQPYKPKRRTRASVAREMGLEPLAQLILDQPVSRQTAEQIAAPFLNEEIPTAEVALAGARDIVAETISDTPLVRQTLRDKTTRFGLLQSHKIEDAKDERAVYRLYYDAEFRLNRLKPYQILAINRGEAEKILRVTVEIFERDWILAMRTSYRHERRSPLAEQLQLAMADAAKRLLLPAIQRDVRRALTEQAEKHAIQIFAANLRGLLFQPPLTGHSVLGIDPAYRTGCKLAVIDATGKVRDTGTIYPHQPQKQREEAQKALLRLVQKHQISLIAIGNGTASRETEQLVAELTRQLSSAQYFIVNEAGASVYSASRLAKAELPELDVTLRGAVSIARRVQDPLAELVKIDPKAIGVGLYQHDVNQKQLSAALDGVVESVVNQVGVDVNTASPALLTYVAGIGPKLAKNIVAYREDNGRFPDREALKNVAGLGPKAFEQSAGFLRVFKGENPLDASAIHPESYEVAAAVLARANLTPATPPDRRRAALNQLPPIAELARQLNTGIPTLTDILEQLVRPGRDPRDDMPRPILRSDVLTLEDLKPGMRLEGTVRNVVDFGAFIDIGLKQDGLLHISQIPKTNTIKVGDILTVSIKSIDPERGRISLGWVKQD